jgi:hypothetical protein
MDEEHVLDDTAAALLCCRRDPEEPVTAFRMQTGSDRRRVDLAVAVTKWRMGRRANQTDT